MVFLLAALVVLAGVYTAPFDWNSGLFPRDPVSVDAIPDIGDNQQIVFTEWPGRSPRDVEDQVSYPLTTALMGIPGVRTVRSSSALGFSSIYLIFEDNVDFYWSRSRVLEKLASLPQGTVPDGVNPTLGPDATALGQVFWYTLEGQDAGGNVVGGWDQDELRAIQDWTVRYALQSAPGVSEVASIGGFVREYQVDVDPDAMAAADVTISEVARAVGRSNLDVGARTLEVNGVEYVVRGLGLVQDIEDIEQAVVLARESTPVRVRDVATVQLGPALRRGALDDEGAPAVGGVVVARYLENPLDVIGQVKDRMAQIQPGLPKRTLEDGTVSQVTLVPFYDRSVLIGETLGTLSRALYQQLLITLIVVLVMLRRLRSSLLISALLPLGVLATFGVMKLAGVGANIMALGGIAIAIGSMVDIGIVFVENIEQHLSREGAVSDRLSTIRRASAEVAPAVVTSVLTTLVSFLPVLGLTAAELRLFAPLAYTKTIAMASVLVLAVLVLPSLSVWVLGKRASQSHGRLRDALLLGVGIGAGLLLVVSWMPLGERLGYVLNTVFAAAVVGGVLFTLRLFEASYESILRWVLVHKVRFLVVPTVIVALGLSAWSTLGREYMPAFDEGSFLYMPTTMPHASIGEVQQMMSALDAAIAQIPEVDRAVGKLGRVDSALDPAPVSMIETVITYHPEYSTQDDGTRVRNWRDHIDSAQDIWDEITSAAQIPGLTGAPTLMPINARVVMLQSGMRAPLGIKVKGPSLEAIEAFGLQIEGVLRDIPSIRAETVFADRVVGKPYLEIDIDRQAIGRFGLTVVDVQEVLQVALGGVTLTRTVEGRERYPVRVRYAREDRDSLEALQRVFIPTAGGEPIPLSQVADFRYVRGPQVIKSEDTFLTSYVLFDKQPGVAETAVVDAARDALVDGIDSGSVVVPEGVSYAFAGSYENQLRSEKRLAVLIPIALVFVFILLYLQFGRIRTTAIIASGVLVAVSGAFGLMWLYGQPWFLNISLFGADLQDVFHTGPVNLSVAVWVGVIALIGLATDDGVVMATYLKQRFDREPVRSRTDARERTVQAGLRRVRPCLMTTATTLLALLPVVTSQGRGSDIMVPLALPLLGGMTIALVTLFVVPTLYCAAEEAGLDD